ncbi:unnamed protein product [Microthlaspi erraticum]|uniref:Uncharacterized protein n=1 Tax=Microthlaspi erraticum TaxID=1685480 RepID=A0A6D2IBR3_9BRAS|nr:unnamed protein product [Microthlaspi erraticum]
MRTRSSSSTEDLVELDNNIGKRQGNKSQKQLAEQEVTGTDTMDDPQSNGNPLGNGNGRARQSRPLVLKMLQTVTNKGKELSLLLSRTTTLRSS